MKSESIYNCNRKLFIQVLPGLPSQLIKLLVDQNIYKFGVNIRNDAQKFHKDFNIKICSLIELSYVAKELHKDKLGSTRHLISLDKLCEFLLNQTLTKGVERISNWELNLNWKQIEYAANDVYASYQMFKTLTKNNHDNLNNYLIDHSIKFDENVEHNFQQRYESINKKFKLMINDKNNERILLKFENNQSVQVKLQLRHDKIKNLYFDQNLSLDYVRSSLRQPPLAKITIIIYASEYLLLNNEGISNAMLNKLENDINNTFFNDKIKLQDWYETYGNLLKNRMNLMN